MRFPINIYLLSFLGAALLAAASLPVWRWFCRRAGLVDDPGARKLHDRPVPLAGGLAVLTALVIPLALVAVLGAWRWFGAEVANKLGYGFAARAGQLGVILAGATGMTFLGLLDDRLELSPAAKFLGQSGVALAVALAGVRITLFVPSAVFSYAVTVLWILTVINAFNFMDNMNGLCAGLGALGAVFFGVAAARSGHYLVASLAFLTVGALVGFLPWNFPRARAFLGDSGSHLTGFLLAVLAILPHFYSAQHPRPVAVLTPLLVLAVPLVDLVWVVGLRLKARKPVYCGDTNHLSHRLVQRGFSRVKAVALIWTLAAVVSACSFFLN